MLDMTELLKFTVSANVHQRKSDSLRISLGRYGQSKYVADM